MQTVSELESNSNEEVIPLSQIKFHYRMLFNTLQFSVSHRDQNFQQK